MDNENYKIRLEEEEKRPYLNIIINQKIYEIQKIPNVLFLYNPHKFNFRKSNGEKYYKLYIDSFSFDEINPNFKPKNEFCPNNKTKNKSVNPDANNNHLKSYEKLIKKNKEINNVPEQKQIRTGSDIYKSDICQSDRNNEKNNCEDMVEKELGIFKKEKAFLKDKNKFPNKKENKAMFESDEKYKNSLSGKNIYCSQNNNVTLNKYKKKYDESIGASEYVDELNEENIPEYERLDEVIFNAY